MRIHKVSQLSFSYSLTGCNMITDADLFPNLKTYLWQQLNSVLHFNDKLYMVKDMHTVEYTAMMEANVYLLICLYTAS